MTVWRKQCSKLLVAKDQISIIVTYNISWMESEVLLPVVIANLKPYPHCGISPWLFHKVYIKAAAGLVTPVAPFTNMD